MLLGGARNRNSSNSNRTSTRQPDMLPEQQKDEYEKLVVALQKRFRSLDIEELRGLEFHQLMQEQGSVEELGVELRSWNGKPFLPAVPGSSTTS